MGRSASMSSSPVDHGSSRSRGVSRTKSILFSNSYREFACQKICIDETIPLDSLAGSYLQRSGKHRSRIRKGVKLTVFAARINASRQIRQERLIKFASGETARKIPGVDTRQPRAKSASDHLLRQL